MGMVLTPMHMLSQLLIHSCQCLCSAPYMRNGCQRLDEEGSISQEGLTVSQRSRYQKVGQTKMANKKFSPNISSKAYKSIISIGNLAQVGQFSPAMPHLCLSTIVFAWHVCSIIIALTSAITKGIIVGLKKMNDKLCCLCSSFSITINKF